MNYRLAVIDLDDTLLGPNKEVSPENRAALQRLRDAGIEIVIASGRQHDNIVKLEDKIGLHGWIISSAGATARRAGSKEALYELTLPLDLAFEIYEQGVALDLTQIGYHRDGIFAERETKWTHIYAGRAKQTPKHGDLRALIRDGLQKILWIDDAKIIGPLVAEKKATYRDRLYVVQTASEHLEFLSPRVSKARGVEAVARELNVRADEVIAFGDGENDVPMFEWAGMSVAMNHGSAPAREAAKKVTPPGPEESAFARGVAMVLG